MKLKQDIRSLTLVPGSGGVFEVVVNGRVIHSKTQTGKFPDPEKIVAAVRALRH